MPQPQPHRQFRAGGAGTGPLAILARDPGKYSETFVRRHIEHLNGGDTVVVTLTEGCRRVLGRPTLNCRQIGQADVRQSLRHPIRAGLAHYARRQRRAALMGFFERHGVGHVLAEFGYVGTEFADALGGSGRQVYCMFRGNDASARLADPAYVRQLRALFPSLAGIAAVSQFLLDRLAEKGLAHERQIVVPSGTDTEAFRPGQAEPGLCICVGRLVGKKSPLPLIRAFAPVAHRNDLRLEIIGDGEQKAPAEALVTELGLGDRVAFLGPLPHAQVRSRLRRAMIYTQHFDTGPEGDSEGMPSVIQEAMACGLPIVTTRHAGIPEHVRDGETGLTVAPGAEAAFGQALERLASSAPLRRQLGQAARDYAVSELDFHLLHQRLERFMGLRDDAA